MWNQPNTMTQNMMPWTSNMQSNYNSMPMNYGNMQTGFNNLGFTSKSKNNFGTQNGYNKFGNTNMNNMYMNYDGNMGMNYGNMRMANQNMGMHHGNNMMQNMNMYDDGSSRSKISKNRKATSKN